MYFVFTKFIISEILFKNSRPRGLLLWRHQYPYSNFVIIQTEKNCSILVSFFRIARSPKLKSRRRQNLEAVFGHLLLQMRSYSFCTTLPYRFLIDLFMFSFVQELEEHDSYPLKIATGTTIVSFVHRVRRLWSDVVLLRTQMISSVQNVPNRSSCNEKKRNRHRTRLISYIFCRLP